jgi:hypothetical protein
MTTPPPAVPAHVVEKIEAYGKAMYEYALHEVGRPYLLAKRAALLAAIADAIEVARQDARQEMRAWKSWRTS